MYFPKKLVQNFQHVCLLHGNKDLSIHENTEINQMPRKPENYQNNCENVKANFFGPSSQLWLYGHWVLEWNPLLLLIALESVFHVTTLTLLWFVLIYCFIAVFFFLPSLTLSAKYKDRFATFIFKEFGWKMNHGKYQLFYIVCVKNAHKKFNDLF